MLQESMDHVLLLIYIASLCLGCIAMYKIIQFNTFSPNPLARKMVIFLILFAAGALFRLALKYVGILQNYDTTQTATIELILSITFIISSSVFFLYYLSIIVYVAYDEVRKWILFSYGLFLLLTAIGMIFFNINIIHITGFSAFGNLLSRLIIYCTLGFTLIRAFRDDSEKKYPRLYFALLYFGLETISIVVNDIAHLWKYYDAFEYFINNLIPFLFALPFLQSLFPRPDTNLEKMRDVFSQYNFSERELAIIKLICDGKLNKEIAGELGIAENTVKFYIYNIYKKINVKNRVELVKHVSLTTNS